MPRRSCGASWPPRGQPWAGWGWMDQPSILRAVLHISTGGMAARLILESLIKKMGQSMRAVKNGKDEKPARNGCFSFRGKGLGKGLGDKLFNPV